MDMDVEMDVAEAREPIRLPRLAKVAPSCPGERR